MAAPTIQAIARPTAAQPRWLSNFSHWEHQRYTAPTPKNTTPAKPKNLSRETELRIISQPINTNTAHAKRTQLHFCLLGR